ncbi:MAG: type II toxin-antitoxin system RelE/ParE family toxin [Rhodocyclaceae bacterium]|nr:type II toxin-antitoxin system RelE/ParE family toxin [Rhodocyclaceae bacterium]
MAELVLRPRARDDPIGIWRFTCREWSEAQADHSLREIDAGFTRLWDNPRLGRARDEVRQSYRSLRINRNVAFYTLAGETIRIVRVLHARMDPEAHL